MQNHALKIRVRKIREGANYASKPCVKEYDITYPEYRLRFVLGYSRTNVAPNTWTSTHIHFEEETVDN
jgi:hypothetical protein